MDRRQLFSAALGGLFAPALGVCAAGAAKVDDWKRRADEIRAATIRAFPYQILKVEGSKALDEWERLKLEGKDYPVVLGTDEDFLRVAEQFQFLSYKKQTPASVLATAADYKYPDDYREQQRVIERSFEEQVKSDPKLKKARDELLQQLPASTGDAPRRGDWPDETGECVGLTVAEAFRFEGNKMEHSPHREVVVALFPTADWTEVFALAGYGGWNSCPPPEAHVAAFRRWNERYGLELVGMAGDVLNLRVGKKPSTREEAIALALEHYEFCPDLVDQGSTLEVLAAELMSCGWWYFWWD